MTPPNLDSNIEFDILDEKCVVAIRKSARKLLARLSRPDDAAHTAIWPDIKNALAKRRKPVRLVLVTLDRIGAELGRSGATVLIGYFPAKQGSRLECSRPMVVKAARPGKRDKLEAEYNQAQGLLPHLAQRDPFALPIHKDLATKHGDYSVLWSQFSSNADFWMRHQETRRPFFGHADLFGLLRKQGSRRSTGEHRDSASSANVKRVLTSVFASLEAAHAQGHQEKRLIERTLEMEYKWYLRFTYRWQDTWKKVWAPATQREVHDFGRKWVNPLWVLDRIKRRSVKLLVGAVHGDLHPRNIVLNAKQEPCLIDFGWTELDAHIIKDFVLLECNLRFVVLDPGLPFEDVEALCRWVRPEDKTPEFSTVYCRERASVISHLRSLAGKRCEFRSAPEWCLQYGAPLFLTAIGLLAHARDFDNLLAARLQILYLAQCLSGFVAEDPSPPPAAGGRH